MSVIGNSGKGRPRRQRSHRRSATLRKTRRDNVLSTLLATSTGRSFLAVTCRAQVTPADAVAPPGSALDTVVSQLRQHTDLPPLLGVAAAMSLIAATMAEAGTTVGWADDGHASEMDLWIIALAGSGGGKTWIREVIAAGFDLTPHQLPEPASAPAYLQSLAECGGRAYWPRDEYGQLLRSIADGGPRGELRDQLLRTYDHAPLVHSTRTRGEIRVERPVLTVFGTSVDSTWRDCIDAQMLADGLMARHLMIVAERRPLSAPRYPRTLMIEAIRANAADIAERLRQRTHYTISPAASAVYDELWRTLVGELGSTLDAAYIRRITWAAARYAAIYHVLRKRAGTTVGVAEMRWAWRMVMLHCWSAREVLVMADTTLAGRVERIIGWILDQRDRGADISAPGYARLVIQRWKRDIRSIREARELIELAKAQPR